MEWQFNLIDPFRPLHQYRFIENSNTLMKYFGKYSCIQFEFYFNSMFSFIINLFKIYGITKKYSTIWKHMLKKVYVLSMWGIENLKSRNNCDLRMSSKAVKPYSQQQSIQFRWWMGPIHNSLEKLCIRISIVQIICFVVDNKSPQGKP